MLRAKNKARYPIQGNDAATGQTHMELHRYKGRYLDEVSLEEVVDREVGNRYKKRAEKLLDKIRHMLNASSDTA